MWIAPRNGSSAIARCASATASSSRPSVGQQVGETRRHGRILRRELEGAAVFRFRGGEIEIDVSRDHALCRMRVGEIRIQLERSLRRGTGFCDQLFSFFSRNTP